MPDVELPSVLQVPRGRLWALLWAFFFFVLINAVALFMWGSPQPFQRFHYHTSYEEVRGMIDVIRKDPRRKVVFLGGSVLWGSSTPDPNNTLPLEFGKLLPADVAVYNLGMIGSRPLDHVIVAWMLRDQADLIIWEYNYQFGFPVERVRLLREPATYIRLRELFASNATPLLEDIPALRSCFDDRDLPLPSERSSIERNLRAISEHAIPVLRYKDRINDLLFGQHPLLLVERSFIELARSLRDPKQFSLRRLFSSPEETIEAIPWRPTGTQDEQSYRVLHQSLRFKSDELLHCITRSFISFADEKSFPLIGYITPMNPGMFPELHGSELHHDNIALLESLFGQLPVVNLDDGTLPAEAFTDATHLMPSTHRILAERLFHRIEPVLQSRGLLIPRP